jgi:hypothetical protein
MTGWDRSRESERIARCPRVDTPASLPSAFSTPHPSPSRGVEPCLRTGSGRPLQMWRWPLTEIGRCNRVRIGPGHAIGSPAKSSRGGCQERVRRNPPGGEMGRGYGDFAGRSTWPAADRLGRDVVVYTRRMRVPPTPFVEPGSVGVGRAALHPIPWERSHSPLDTGSRAALTSRHSCGSAPTDNQPMTIGCSAPCCRRLFGRRL